MICAILLLASLANAQEVSTGAATSLLDEVRISNLGKDTRDLLSGRYRQTGKPTFANGFCFADGTCQTTRAANGNTLGQGTTFYGTVTISSFSYQSVAANGFVEIGPLLIQWGQYTGGANSPAITFPVAFSTLYSVTGNVTDGAAQNGVMLEIITPTTTGFTGNQRRHDSASITDNFYWLAVGRR